MIGCVEKDRDLVERACAIAGIISPDDGVNGVVDEVTFDRESELGKDIVAGFEIVTDSGIENGFAVNGLIAKTGAPGLEKVHAYGGAKDRSFIGAIKIFK